MVDELTALEQWASALLAQLSPAARRAAMRNVATELRRSQQNRIRAQSNPDGGQYTPRKRRREGRNLRGKSGRIKRDAMFVKLRMARFLTIAVDGNGLSVGFDGRVARIASVHQFGLTDRVAHGIETRYPARVLLGFTDADREMIRDMLLKNLTQHPGL